MKLALVYDRINKWGGAERILLALHKIFPKADLFTSVYNRDLAPWAKIFNVKTSFLQNLPIARSHHEYFAPIMPLGFESFNFDNYDSIISLTSESAKGIITKPNAQHICICLTPTRYLWSGYNEYFQNPQIKFFSKPLVSYMKKWDLIAANRPDQYISISKEVKNRIKKYYNRDSILIYPPVDIPERNADQRKNKGKYFLVVSRLSKFTKYKRVDLAIKACNQLKLPLVIVGDGDLRIFKKISGPTIKFVGKISDLELSKYYFDCKALLFPSNEDFGIVPLEAQAHGKPVIACRMGGALETVIEGKTGMFFDHQTVESLVRALKSFRENDYNINECRRNAELFSFKKFEESIKSVLYKI